MSKDTNYTTTRKPRSRLFLQLGMAQARMPFRGEDEMQSKPQPEKVDQANRFTKYRYNTHPSAKSIRGLAAWITLAMATLAHAQSILFVDDSASGSKNGTSWMDAYTDLQIALDQAATLTGPIEIRIAEGVYRPSAPEPYGDPADARSVTFQMQNHVSLVGGFAGVGSVNPDERDFSLHRTVLSGDLNGDDGPNWSNRGDNAFHVLYASQLDETAVLDGLTIYGGSAAPASSFFQRYGGAITSSLSNYVVRDCTFTGNWAAEGGGALYLSNSNAVFQRCHFLENKAKGGGAIHLESDKPLFIESEFRHNVADINGGAVSGHGAAEFQNCAFIENHAGGCGGAVDVDGGHPLLVNSLFVGNVAVKGGALCNESWYRDTQMVGCTLSQNTATIGGAVYDDSITGSRLVATNSIIWGNSGTPAIAVDYAPTRPQISFSCIQGGWNFPGSINNISTGPGFVNPVGPDGNYRLSAGSPCIDAGDSLSLPSDFGDVDGDGIIMEPIPVDLDHSPRVVDQMAVVDTGQGFGPKIDMGVYEFLADCNGNHVDDRTEIQSGAASDCDANGIPDQCQADCDANGVADSCQIEDGLSEDCNLNGRMDLCDLAAEVATDCNHNNRLDECELTLGTSFDCNATGLLDECDLEAGTSLDCDGNGMPDECEPDCNVNDVTDACDIRDGTSKDCNANQVPDECDIRDRRSNDCNNDGVPNECQASAPELSDGNGNGVPDSCEIPILYVDATTSAGGDGSSWTTAYNDLSTALNHAYWAAPWVANVHVSGGVYRPAGRTDPLEARSATFLLVPSVELVGGFAGRTAADPNLRDPVAFVTQLDGDIKQDDQPELGNRSDNVYHVVSALGIGNLGTLDGFTIRGGQADGINDAFGAGLYLFESVPKIAACKFTDNFAGRVIPPSPPNPGYTLGCGGAISYWTEEYIEVPAEVSIEDSEFFGNQSLDSGGAVCGQDVSFSFRACVFRDNQAKNGGAFGSSYSYTNPTDSFDACIFENNSAGYGGAIYADSGSVSLIDCSLTNNEADSGGAIYARAALDISDTTFDSNTADDRGGGIDIENGTAQLTRCTFSNNQATYGGGAILGLGYLAQVFDCRFEGNSATIRGGGLHTLTSVVVMDSCQFKDNEAGDKGGGLISRGTSTITNCRFESNSANQGGGMYHDGDGLVLADSHFELNSADFGGALGIGSYTGYGPVTVERCEIINNEAMEGGGVSAIESYGDLELRDCLIAQNYADGYAGGLAGGGESLHIFGCTIANNTADDVGGGIVAVENTSIQNSILWGNRVHSISDQYAQIEALHFAQVSFSTVQGWIGESEGTSVSGEDPLFVEPHYFSWRPDPLGNYHVQTDSPAINAGDPAFVPEPAESDLDGHARVLCGRVDMGAYESGIGDMNCDEQVDLIDFASWPSCSTAVALPAQCLPLDFNNDGDIDLADFAAMQQLSWNQ